MASGKKGLFRLVFGLLIIPIAIVLFLHFFGRNEMKVEPIRQLVNCDLPKDMSVVLSGIPESNGHRNQLKRINRKLEKQRLEIDSSKYSCLSDTLALLLIDGNQQLMGSYQLNQLEVNRFFMELEIVYLRENYGKGVSR